MLRTCTVAMPISVFQWKVIHLAFIYEQGCPTGFTSEIVFHDTRFRLYGLRIHGLFDFISVIWSLENVFPCMKFRNMVISAIWSILAGPDVDHISGTESKIQLDHYVELK